jgi:hypothetical protein
MSDVRSSLIRDGIVDANDVYCLPDEAFTRETSYTGWWIFLADESVLGPYGAEAEAVLALNEPNPFVNIDPTSSRIVFLTEVTTPTKGENSNE